MSCERVNSEQPLSVADTIIARLDRLQFSRFHLKIAAILGTGTFFDAYDAVVIGTVLTVIFTTLHIGFAASGLLIGAAYIGQFFGAILAGILAEVYGRKVVFTTSLLVFGLLSFGTAVSWNFQSLLVFRILQGLGLGAEIPVAGALLNELVPGKRRGIISISYQNMFGWGIFLTPLLGAVIFALVGPEIGWRILFLVGALPLLLAFLAYRVLPESPRWLIDHRKFRDAEELITRIEQNAEQHSRAQLPEDHGPASELLANDPTVHAEVETTKFGELFSSFYLPRTALIWIMFATTYFISYGYSGWLPTLYVQIGGLPITQSLLLSVISGVVTVITGYISATLVDRLGRRRYFLAGYIIAIVGTTLGVVTTFFFHFVGWPILFASTLIIAIGTYPVNIGLYLYSSELFPTRMRSWAMGTGSGIQRLVSAISPFIVGLLVASGGQSAISHMFAIFLIVALVGLASVIFLGQETGKHILEKLAH